MSRHWLPPTLETERLVLRAVAETDADAVFAACSNPALTRYTLFDTHRTRDESVSFVRDYVAGSYLEGTPDPFAVTLKRDPDPRLVGCVGCHWANRSDRVLELGYWLAEHLWGRGIAAEASAAVLQFAFAQYAVERIQARVIVGNTASVRVLEKVGFRYEGTHRALIYRRGKFEDVMMFARLHTDG